MENVSKTGNSEVARFRLNLCWPNRMPMSHHTNTQQTKGKTLFHVWPGMGILKPTLPSVATLGITCKMIKVNLTQVREQSSAVINTILNLHIPQKPRNF
jgi:hypothetical protein